MPLVDIAILILLAGSIVSGITKGFVRTAFGMGGLFFGLLIAAWNYHHPAHILLHLVHFEALANAIGFVLLAVVVMTVCGWLGEVLAKALHTVGLGCLDRLAGAVLGLCRGLMVVMLFVWVTVAFFPSARWLTQARLPRSFFGACHVSTHVSPEDLAEKVRHSLGELEEESPEWMHPKSE